MFKYLGRPLDLWEDDWPAVLRNIRKARQVWGHLGKMLQREGENPEVSTKFYRAVIKALLLLFGVETWVLPVPMARRLEVVHVGFPRQVNKLKAKSLKYDTWRNVSVDRMLQGAGTQPLHTYLDRRQATVAEWVALQTIFEVFARETGYEGGGNLWEPRRRQAAAEKQLMVTLKEIFTRQGISGDGNPAGVAGVREGRRGKLLTATGKGESQEYRFSGTETCDVWVGR